MQLTQYFLTESDCFQAGRSIVPQGVMVHSTGADNPRIARYTRAWNRPGVEKCVHAFVGLLEDGSAGAVQTLPWDHRGWHAGTGTSGKSANNSHISFEICEDGLEDPVYFQRVYQISVELTARLCREFELDPIAEGVVLCHQEGYQRGIASNHGDVLHWFPKFGKSMDDFRADVAREMEGSPLQPLTEAQVRAIARDEYAKLAVEAAALPPSQWAAALLEEAVRRGVTDGTRPQSFATRQEAALMVTAALKQQKAGAPE